MRFSTILVVLSAAFATTSAALLEKRQDGYADCALPCLASVDTGSCARDDANCLCRNEQFVEDTTLCFESKCSGADLDKSIAAAIAMCRAVGVTLTSSIALPSSTPAPSSGTSTSSPASTGTGTSSGSNSDSGVSNGVNVLFVLTALGLVGYAL